MEFDEKFIVESNINEYVKKKNSIFFKDTNSYEHRLSTTKLLVK